MKRMARKSKTNMRDTKIEKKIVFLYASVKNGAIARGKKIKAKKKYKAKKAKNKIHKAKKE